MRKAMSAMTMLLATAALALSACRQNTQTQPLSNSSEQSSEADRQPTAIPPPGTGPDAKTPLAEPRNAIDPQSPEAAGQVVQHFGALIGENEFREASKLWGSADAASEFMKDMRPSTHLEIGDLGQTEGAAGSIYTTIPVVFYGDTFRRPARIILRRTNDVPGSTDEQRHWHIERIEWDQPPNI